MSVVPNSHACSNKLVKSSFSISGSPASTGISAVNALNEIEILIVSTVLEILVVKNNTYIQ